MSEFPQGFLWGASTAPHQVEGNNLNSDFWASEGRLPGMERSGDACDSYHRYREDIRLLAESGLNSYRFGIEWARIEPLPGLISHAELAHYQRVIDTCREFGVTPVVTLHHFTNPLWFAEEGGLAGARRDRPVPGLCGGGSADPRGCAVDRDDERAEHAGDDDRAGGAAAGTQER
ncbi:family 1 glycosylhydrolase [Rathayibacter sp. CAU 1779]